VGLRTLCEYNLPALAWPDDENDAESWLKQWERAFDVEVVTDKFFREFRDLFEDVKAALPKSIRQPTDRHAFTQRLLNRLLFLCFLQKKRWLKAADLAHPRTTYLFDLFDSAIAQGEEFYADYLYATGRPPWVMTGSVIASLRSWASSRFSTVASLTRLMRWMRRARSCCPTDSFCLSSARTACSGAITSLSPNPHRSTKKWPLTPRCWARSLRLSC